MQSEADPSSPKVWTLREVVTFATSDFQKRGLESPRLEAELLISFALGVDRIRLILEAARPLTGTELSRCRELIARRRKGEPLAYIQGYRDFFGHRFRVDSRVLIPRPDTEILVEVALKRSQKRSLFGRYLDVCTGSGCVAISFAIERPTWQLTATDLSLPALELAAENALRLGTSHNLRFLPGDLLAALPAGEKFEVITSNPPYIARAECEELSTEVRDYEPRQALDGGEDGLDFYRRLVPEARRFLVPGGVLALEMGWDQGPALLELFASAAYTEIELTQDYGKRDRVVSGKAPRS